MSLGKKKAQKTTYDYLLHEIAPAVISGGARRIPGTLFSRSRAQAPPNECRGSARRQVHLSSREHSTCAHCPQSDHFISLSRAHRTAASESNLLI